MNKRAILIAGPTASGKSSFALQVARSVDGIIINADALQVYQSWRVLTARPSDAELRQAPHFLYGHIAKTTKYSVGQWLKDVAAVLEKTNRPAIIIGGTGLYFAALTNGLAEIPPIPDAVRRRGDLYRQSQGVAWFCAQLKQHDPDTFAKLDQNNPARLQRAWEVLEATGKGLSHWHAHPALPLVPLENAHAFVINWPVEALNSRIDRRFDMMMQNGALKECEAARMAGFEPDLPANRALGAREIIAALDGKITMQDAVIKAKIITHQFAKRQRTWFRSKMKNWQQIDMPMQESQGEILAHLAVEFR